MKRRTPHAPGATATARMMTARAGRRSYVPASHLEGIPRSGEREQAVALLLEGLARH